MEFGNKFPENFDHINIEDLLRGIDNKVEAILNILNDQSLPYKKEFISFKKSLEIYHTIPKGLNRVCYLEPIIKRIGKLLDVLKKEYHKELYLFISIIDDLNYSFKILKFRKEDLQYKMFSYIDIFLQMSEKYSHSIGFINIINDIVLILIEIKRGERDLNENTINILLDKLSNLKKVLDVEDVNFGTSEIAAIVVFKHKLEEYSVLYKTNYN